MSPSEVRSDVVGAAAVRRWRVAIVAAALMLLGPGYAAQFTTPQRPRDASGAISGVIVDAVSGAPLADAMLTLKVGIPGSAQRQDVASGLTDVRGRFVFVELTPSDSYFVTVSKPGYLDYRSPTSIPIDSGRWLADVGLELTPAAQIEGRVLFEADDPAIGADVGLWLEAWIAGKPQLVRAAQSITDDRGAFSFPDVKPGRYAVCVLSVQATVPPELLERVAPEPGGTLSSIDVGGVGFVVDEALPPAQREDGRLLTYPSRCEPVTGGMSSDGLLAVDAGQARHVELEVSPEAGFSVRGIVEGPASTYEGLLLRLYHVMSGSLPFSPPLDTATTLVGKGGEFTFAGIPSGRYKVEPADIISTYSAGSLAPIAPLGWRSTGAWTGRSPSTGTSGIRLDTRSTPGARTEWGDASVDVGSDVDGVTVRLASPGYLSGHVAWSGSSPLRETSVDLLLEPAWGEVALGVAGDHISMSDLDAGRLEFDIGRIRPGTYFLRTIRQGWAIRSVRYGGQDVTNQPWVWGGSERFDNVVVELTDDTATLSGRIESPDQPDRKVTVIAFPRDRAAWAPLGLRPPRFRTVQAKLTGEYVITGLPAGQYFAAAVIGELPPAWASTAFLERLAAIAVEKDIAWGDDAAVNLTARTIR